MTWIHSGEQKIEGAIQTIYAVCRKFGSATSPGNGKSDKSSH